MRKTTAEILNATCSTAVFLRQRFIIFILYEIKDYSKLLMSYSFSSRIGNRNVHLVMRFHSDWLYVNARMCLMHIGHLQKAAFPWGK